HRLILFLLFSTLPPPSVSYTLSLHDALPISRRRTVPRAALAAAAAAAARLPPAAVAGRRSAARRHHPHRCPPGAATSRPRCARADRKSTRLNSSHVKISYAVFCLKKKNKIKQ